LFSDAHAFAFCFLQIVLLLSVLFWRSLVLWYLCAGRRAGGVESKEGFVSLGLEGTD
jgi:hypothetical protein